MSATAGRTRTDGLLGQLLGLLFVRSEVEDVEQVTPRKRKIRLTGAEIGALSLVPGQHVRVRTGQGLRSYSVWSHDGDALELCVLDHGDGPGGRGQDLPGGPGAPDARPWLAAPVRAGQAVLGAGQARHGVDPG
jgi:hypothetical protein